MLLIVHVILLSLRQSLKRLHFTGKARRQALLLVCLQIICPCMRLANLLQMFCNCSATLYNLAVDAPLQGQLPRLVKRMEIRYELVSTTAVVSDRRIDRASSLGSARGSTTANRWTKYCCIPCPGEAETLFAHHPDRAEGSTIRSPTRRLG